MIRPLEMPNSFSKPSKEMLVNLLKKKGNPVYVIMLFILLTGQQLYAQEHADCETAYEVCSIYDSVVAKTLWGPGKHPNEAHTPCVGQGAKKFGDGEDASFWVKWKIKKAGKLIFIIHPLRVGDDIDFFLYRIKDGEVPCSKREREIVRCMATGGRPGNNEDQCLGPTGLRMGHAKTSETSGCRYVNSHANVTIHKTNASQFLKEVDAKEGEEYMLLINNCSRKKYLQEKDGFSLYFGGDAEFECPNEGMPRKIEGVATELKEEVEVKSKEVTIKVWDNQIVDGDVISIYLNDKKIVDKLTLTKEKSEYKITLTQEDNYLSIYSNSFGKIEPNTVSIIIDDNKSSSTFKLRSTRKKLDTIKISLSDD